MASIMGLGKTRMRGKCINSRPRAYALGYPARPLRGPEFRATNSLVVDEDLVKRQNKVGVHCPAILAGGPELR